MAWDSRRAAGLRARLGGPARCARLLILISFLALGLTYSVLTPVFETPDEIQHFFYAKALADGQGLPVQRVPAGGLWLQEGSQPPLYYALAAVLIAPLDTGDAAQLLWNNPYANLGNPLYPANKNHIIHTDREAWPYRGAVLAIHLVRVLSLLLGAGTIWLVYGIAEALLPGQASLALAAMALTAFTPQFLFISGAISNDNLITFLATLGIRLALRTLRGVRDGAARTTRRYLAQMAGIGLVLGLAALAKLSGLALCAIVVTALLIGGLRQGALRRTLTGLAVAVAVALLIAGWWYWRNWTLYRDFTGLNRMLDLVGRRERPLSLSELFGQFQGLRISYWALFGWFNLPLPEGVYRVLDAFGAVALAGLVWGWLRRGRGVLAANWPRLLLPLAWIGLMLMSLVRWTLLTPATQGRLLYPAAWAINLLLVLGWSQWAGTRRRSAWLAAPVALLALLAVASPFAVIRPAYARPALIQPDAVPAAARLSPVSHGDAIRSLGGGVEPAAAHPGDMVWVTNYWGGTRTLDADYTTFVHLLDHRGQSVAEANSFPGLGNYPTRLWQPGAVVVDRYPVLIPGGTAAPALLRADVGLFLKTPSQELPSRSSSGALIPNIVGTLRLLPSTVEAPQPATRLDVRFDDRIRLLGFDLSPQGRVAPGQEVKVTLYWEADTRLPEDYKVFVHLRDAKSANLTQRDQQPLDGAWPTSAWEPGQPVTDRYSLKIPPQTARRL